MLLIGEAPSQRGDPGEPLSGRIGKRLAGILGIALDEYLQTIERVNLLQSWPGSAGKGSKFPLELAKPAAEILMDTTVLQHGTVLLLGRRVAAAFDMDWLGYLEWCEFEGTNFAVIPHPSGINRWYNSIANVERLRCFLREREDLHAGEP